MGLHYLIDGYNVIYAWPEIPPGAWQLKREFLLRFLKSQKPHGNNAVTVVFDSREGSGSQSSDGGISVVYTAGETADDWISNKVRGTANPRTLVVVSNDKGIRNLIRGTGAKFQSATEFLQTSRSSSTPKNKRSEAPPAVADDITEEFKKKWL